jgi:hypothetical protein
MDELPRIASQQSKIIFSPPVIETRANSQTEEERKRNKANKRKRNFG